MEGKIRRDVVKRNLKLDHGEYGHDSHFLIFVFCSYYEQLIMLGTNS